MNLIWHPVCDYVDVRAFEYTHIDWIKPVLCEPLKIPGDQCYRKNNDFINTQEIIDDDYYGFLHDDDMYPPGFIDKIKEQSAKIIFYSASRGDAWPPHDNSPYKWPPHDLTINTIDDVAVSKIDMCQCIIKGEILRQTQFGNDSVCDDGIYMVNLKQKWPNEVLILPEIGVNFNYFQPGRYTQDRGYGIKI